MTETKVLYQAHPSMFKSHPFKFMVTLLLCFAGIGFIIFLFWWLNCKGTQITITNERTTLRTGILSKHTNEIYHSDVRNIQLSQSLFQRIFKTGSLGISSAGQGGIEIQIHGIPDPASAKTAIDNNRNN